MEEFEGQSVLAAIEVEREVGELASLGLVNVDSERVVCLLCIDD